MILAWLGLGKKRKEKIGKEKRKEKKIKEVYFLTLG